MPLSRRQQAIAVVVIALLAAVPTLGAGFVHDDRALLEDGTRLGWSQLFEVLSHDLFWLAEGHRPSPYWRPLIGLSYVVEHGVGGGAAWVHHLGNVLFTVLFAVVTWLACGRRRSALAAVALVIVHPLLVEPIANITARTDLLVATFGTLSLLLTGPGSLVALVVALGCKETAVWVPLLVAIRERARGEGTPVSVLAALPHTLVVAVYLGLRQLIELGPSTPPDLGQVPARLGHHLTLLVWPGPGPRPELDLSMLPELPVVAGVAVVLAVGAVVSGLAKRPPSTAPMPVAVAVGTVLLPLLLVSGLAAGDVRHADGFLAWPLVGVAVLLARLPHPAQLVMWGAVVVLAAGHPGRLSAWQSPETLWTRALSAHPDDARVRIKTARVFLELDPQRTLALVQPVLDHPTAANRREAHELSAQAVVSAYGIEDDHIDVILGHARLAADPDDPERTWSLDVRCTLDEAPSAPPTRREICAALVDRRPDHHSAWNTLGVLAAQQGDLAFARACFAEAVTLAPDHAVYRANLDAAEDTLGRQ